MGGANESPSCTVVRVRMVRRTRGVRLMVVMVVLHVHFTAVCAIVFRLVNAYSVFH